MPIFPPFQSPESKECKKTLIKTSFDMSYHRTWQSGAGDKPKQLRDGAVSYKPDLLWRPLMTFLQEVSLITAPSLKLMKNNSLAYVVYIIREHILRLKNNHKQQDHHQSYRIVRGDPL